MTEPKRKILTMVMRVVVLSFSLLVFNVAIALGFTWIAQETNTIGLAWAALVFWLGAGVVAGVVFRKMLPNPVLISAVVVPMFLSVPVYVWIGYSVFHWRGLMKP